MTVEDNRYNLVEEAKQLVPFYPEHQSFCLFLYLALRHLKCGVKKSIQLVQRELRNNYRELDYKDLYESPENDVVQHEDTGKFIHVLHLQTQENIIEFEKETDIHPTRSNLSHLLWVEAIRSKSRGPTEFKNILKEVHEQIVNPLGG